MLIRQAKHSWISNVFVLHIGNLKVRSKYLSNVAILLFVHSNSKLISQIDLSRCGGKLRVTSFSGLFGTKAKLYNIERISDVKY